MTMARAWTIGGLALGLALLAAGASAQSSGASASVTPAVAAPGEVLTFVFTTAPGAVDLALQRTASCTISGPDGATAACGSGTTLVVARVAPAQTAYTWEVEAPATPGDYTVVFAETSAVALATSSAEAAFRVAAAPLDDAADPASDPLPPAVEDDAPSGPSGDEARWLFSTMLGGGSLAALVGTVRPGRSP